MPARKLEKLNSLSPKFGSLDLSLPDGLKVRKRVRFNSRCDKLAVWWTSHFWPPSDDLRNVTICRLEGGTAKKVQEFTTEHPLVAFDFRRSVENEFALGELQQKSKSNFNFHISVFELRENQLVKRRTASLAVSHAVISWEVHPKDDLFLLRMDNSKSILYDLNYQQSKAIEASNVAMARWHSNGVFFFIVTSMGEVQAFDLAGSGVNFLFQDNFASHPKSAVNLLKYFRCNKKIVKFTACREDNTRWVMLHESGPLALLHLPAETSAAQLAHSYCCEGLQESAVRLLRALHWNSRPEECFAALGTILSALLARPALKENVDLCEEALGSFFISREPLAETVRLEFREKLMLLSRRFFFYLLRSRHMEKAFLLAEDLGHLDLFSDLHRAALAQGDSVLAEVARLRAIQRHREEEEASEVDSGDSCEIREEDLPAELFVAGRPDFAFEEAVLKEFSKVLSND